jgi:KEOPS complex subunit Cgi121
MYVAIAGFRDAKIGNVNQFFETLRKELGDVAAVQFFDARLVATWQHLYFAALNAFTAFKNKTNISNNLAIETLLYASAQRQIKKATEMIGIKPKTSEVAVLIMAENQKTANVALKTVQKLASAKQDDNVLELSPEKIVEIKQFFGISEVEFSAKLEKKGLEREALVDLVVEHVALLVTQR